MSSKTSAGSRSSQPIPVWVLVGACAFLLWQGIDLHRYVRTDTRPPAWDQAVHLETAWDYREAIREGRWTAPLHMAPKPGMPPFPPFYYLALMFTYGTSDPAGAALWLNWIYLAILCGALLAIAHRFKPDGTALAAVVLFAGAPAVQEACHTQLMDLSVAAWAAVAYWALLRSERFSRWDGSAFFALAYVVGMLHKWSFFSYLAPAYWIGLEAAFDPARRKKVLAAGGIVLAGLGPWYLANLPVLFPRLIEASADNAVVFWKGAAFFQYFKNLPAEMGPWLWLLGCVGLAMPFAARRRDQVWIPAMWFLTSYVFWAIVPNRQMRFLLAGLPPLAIAAAWPWPRRWIWVFAGLQFLSAANFTRAWIKPFSVPVPGLNVQFFPVQPPRGEDWKLAEVLRAAERLHPPERPFSNLTLVANDAWFNGPNFNWAVKWLGLPHVRIRGVNRRLCEFSEFVALKQGVLGPPGVISGLPEAEAIIRNPKGWFPRAYAPVRQWGLPDGSVAVLYQQRRAKKAPFSGSEFAFPKYTAATGAFSARNLRISLGGWDPARAVYPSASATADSVELRGLTVEGLRVGLEDLRIVPAGGAPSRAPWADVRLLRMETLRVRHLEITAAGLRKFLQKRVPGLLVSNVTLQDGIDVSGKFKSIPFSVSMEISLARRRELVFVPRRLRVGPISLGSRLLGPWATLRVSLDPNPETPFVIDIPRLKLAENRLVIGSKDAP